MADPTIKDVLEAVQRLAGGLDEVRRDVAEVRRDVKALDMKVDAGFVRVEGAIRDLGEDIDRHMTVHKKLEKDVAALKVKPARPASRAPRRR